MANGGDAVHYRHLDIHGHHIRFQFCHLLDGFFAIGSATDDLDALVSFQYFDNTPAKKP